ncbi:VPA1262 family N-terminal domain-containing protein [Bradyrhizobium ottawaense]|uniref:VPA1262 family N-terminal domain-containing protein n=1 Tax=Bradyrhizobium ottawaense TaxID=931866 RepID=UPI0012603A5B|nr:VPA1262 family N-terminal domain-containing protein [Bradyrhizobium ottawaense]MBR1326068.1 hypothetical protein [Bradyrhizobium ottawaense]
MTISEANTSDTRPAGSWWIWICWLEREGGGGFVYGCAARVSRPAGWSNDHGIPLADVGHVRIAQRTVGNGTFQLFEDALHAGIIDLGSLLGQLPFQVKVAATRLVIQEALGQSAVRGRLFYTLPSLKALLGDAERALEAVLTILNEEFNFPFKDKYAARLGNFEIFELNSWLERSPPFLIESARETARDLGGPQTIDICRTPEFAKTSHRAHVVGRAAGDIVFDRLIALPEDKRRVSVPASEPLDQIEFRLFDETGDTLLHFERGNFVNRVGFVMMPLGRQMTIVDDLTQRVVGAGRALVSKASTVISHSSHRSMVGGPAKGSWRHFADEMSSLVAAQLPKPSEDRWFERGVEGEVGAIAHLNSLLNGGRIRAAVLVDPWFGADALVRFALRLGSQDIHLSIITSWATVDPDTNVALDPVRDPTEKLEAALRQIEPFLNPRLSIVNLIDGKQQAFHDRYLLLYPHEGPDKVFLLSNSINRIAGNWPFSMSLFSPDVGREIQRYIEGLCDGRDTARNRTLTTSFRWPANAS